MTRKQLPNRRPNVTVQTDWDGHPLSITVGFHPRTGRASEVFADSAKGGQMADTLRDACVWASLILQSGMTPQELTKSLGRVPDYTGTERAASPLGVIAQVVAEVDA
jgi:hypothetical protein